MFRLIYTLLFLASGYWTMAQTTISGTVKDEGGMGIVGANVFLKYTYDGASTETEGHFSFETTETGALTLVVSCIGYQNLEVPLPDEDQPLRLQLAPAANELETVVISAGAFEAGDEKKAVVLRSLDIVTTAGATADIAAALNTLPGTQKVGEEGKLFVRGGAAYETRTFIDGLAVQNPYSSSLPNLPSRGRFSPFLFKGVLFSTGGYSAEYGQALSSALLLHTQDLAPETLTSVSLMTVGLGLSHTRRWENTSLSASADYSDLSPYLALAPQNIDWEKAPRSIGSQLVFRHKTNETGMLKVMANAGRSGFSLQYPSGNNVRQLEETALRNTHYFATASYQEVLGEKWALFTGLAFTSNDDVVRQGFNFNTQEQSVQGKVRLSYHPQAQVGLKFGAEYLNDQYAEDYRSEPGQGYRNGLQDHFAAVFAESDISLNRRMAARLGARMEYSSLIGSFNWAPRLSLAYKTGSKSQVALAYGQFFQNPEKELYRHGGALGFEKATHYIVNYQWLTGKRTFRIEGYYKKYRQLVRNGGTPGTGQDNSGYGYAGGLDLLYRDQESVRNGDFWVSYSYLDTRRLYREFPAEAVPHFASKHNLSAVYKHWLGFLDTYAGFTYLYAAPRPYHDPNQTAFNNGRTAAYHDLSLNASYLTNLFGQFTIVYVSVSNVPGFRNTFGYRFANEPDGGGHYAATPVLPPARRFFFVGVFVSIGQTNAINNQ